MFTTKWPVKVSLAAVFLLILAMVAPAVAQDGRGVAVHERPRPGYDALGMRAGAFTLMPELTVGATYNDNIYAVPNNTTSSWITTIAPRLTAASGWSRHALGLDVGARFGFYTEDSDEDFADAHLRLNGRLDVMRNVFFEARADIARLHEERGDPDTGLLDDEPTVYVRSAADGFYQHGFGRTTVRLGGGYLGLDFNSVDQVDGTSKSLDHRDRNVYNVDTRLSYELLPNVSPFVTGRYEWRRYDEATANRDSKGYRVGAGTAFDLGGVTTGEVFAGYMKQEYDDSFREDISGLWYGMSLLANVTRLTSIEAKAQKSVKETTRAGTSGIDALDVQLRADHELLRNLLVGAYANYTHDKYEGSGNQPTDKIYTMGPRITYLWNRNLSARLEYAYKDKSSSSDFKNREYTENRVMLSLTGRI